MRRRESLHTMRRWSPVILVSVLIGAVVGWVSAPGTAATATPFQATHSLILSPEAGQEFQIYRLGLLASRGAVPDRVAGRLGIDRLLVQSMVTVETRDNARELLITGRSTDPAQAEALANVTAEELLVEVGGTSAPLQTLEPAVASPVETDDFRGPSSNRSRALLLGAFGLFLGLGAAFTVDRYDSRIRSKRVAEEVLGVPVMAEVPPIPRSERGRMVSGEHPSSFIEAYRGLRTSVVRWTPKADHDDGHRVIVVTSATAGEGKTTTVAHLAATLAETGRTVLVISADLRRPRLHLYFDRARDPGLVDVLEGSPGCPTLADLDLTTAIRGVRFVSSGAPVLNPALFLEHAGPTLRAARRLCDFVLVDSPPLLMTTDAPALARHADGVLFVVRAGHTSIGAAARSAELLERLHIPVLGAVLVASEGAPAASRAPRAGYRARSGRRRGESSASRVIQRAPSR